MNSKTNERIARGYLACALWTGTAEDGEPLDKRYTVDDFTKEAKALALAVVYEFVRLASDDLELLDETMDYTDEQIGHDLALASGGHDVGFWSLDLDLGDRLTEHATRSHYTEGAYECGNNRHLALWVEVSP